MSIRCIMWCRCRRSGFARPAPRNPFCGQCSPRSQHAARPRSCRARRHLEGGWIRRVVIRSAGTGGMTSARSRASGSSNTGASEPKRSGSHTGVGGWMVAASRAGGSGEAKAGARDTLSSTRRGRAGAIASSSRSDGYGGQQAVRRQLCAPCSGPGWPGIDPDRRALGPQPIAAESRGKLRLLRGVSDGEGCAVFREAAVGRRAAESRQEIVAAPDPAAEIVFRARLRRGGLPQPDRPGEPEARIPVERAPGWLRGGFAATAPDPRRRRRGCGVPRDSRAGVCEVGGIIARRGQPAVKTHRREP